MCLYIESQKLALYVFRGNPLKNVPSWMPLIEELKRAVAVRDRAATNAAVVKLLNCRAPIGEHWRSFSELMRISGELTLARQAMDEFVAAAGHSPQAQYSKAVLLTQSGKMREAYKLVTQLPPNIPTRAGRQYVLGNTAIAMGMINEAISHLKKAVKHNPGWGPAWLTLASSLNLANDPMGKRLLQDKVAAEKQPDGDLARYYYALGKLYVDRSETAAAFSAYAKGAKLLRKEVPYSEKGNQKNAHAAMSGFDNDLIEHTAKQVKNKTSRPIFVTGLPRSGTTLVEQILASHSQVADGAELNIAQHIAVQTGGNSGHDLKNYLSKGGSVNDLTKLYLHLLTEKYGTEGRIVDKTIDVSRYLGLIATVLPDAPLIWMRRDPIDSAWSCFRTFFIHGVGWSYDLKDIAHHFLLEDALLDYWQERLGKRLLVVPYHQLVDNPAEWTRTILNHCGLEDELGVYSPHETNRVVMTASALQVRKPINKDGLNVSSPYIKQLQPFVDAYSKNV